MSKPSITLFALTLGLVGALGLGSCGTTDADHAGRDHGDAAEIATEAPTEEAPTAEAAAVADAPAMEGMVEVDPEGAVRFWDAKPEVGAKGICPVSNEAFLVTDKTVFSVVDGKFYGYCCPGCQGRFEADPQSFLSRGAES